MSLHRWIFGPDETNLEALCIAEDCGEVRQAPYTLCGRHLKIRNPDGYYDCFIGGFYTWKDYHNGRR